MAIFTKAQTEQLLADGRAQRAAIDQQNQALDCHTSTVGA
jgi:hypothetical protein